MDTRSLSLPVFLPSGEDCLRCIARLQDGLLSLKGVEEASVNNGHDTLRIVYDPNFVTYSRIENEARRIGADIALRVDHATVALDGLDCPDCARSIARSLEAMEGVLWAGTSFAAAQAHVEFERNQVETGTLLKRIARHGVQPRLLDTSGTLADRIPPLTEDGSSDILPFLLNRYKPTLLSAVLGLFGLLLGLFTAPPALVWASRLFYAAAIIIGGLSTFRAAWLSLRTRSMDMNVLMMLAVLGAAATEQWGEATAVVLLYSIGNALQAATLERTRRSLRTLMSLAPQRATVRRDGKETSLRVSEVHIGDTIIIRPGERVPLDGTVTNGHSAINEAPVTGESMPVEKERGATVYAGTLNGQGALEVRVTKFYRDTVLSRIAHSVEQAQAQRAPSEQLIDRFARFYTPLVFWLAVFVAVVPPLLAAGDFMWYFPTWFHRGLSLLLIACPCALVISTPVAIVTALGTATRHGVLIKGGAYLEAIGDVKAIVYDKTGTLTQGRPTVEDVIPVSNMTCADIIAMAAALLEHSTHPLASAIRDEAARHPAQTYVVTDYEELPGRGARGHVDGTLTLVGSVRLFTQSRVQLPRLAEETLAEAESRGKTVVMVGNSQTTLGLIVLSDAPRPEARQVVSQLHQLGIHFQTLLSGDNMRVAAQVAQAAGLEEFEGGMLPEQKVTRLRALQRQYGRVAMVGDGINDAPALAAADVGIAMGAAGSDTALEASDIALMRDDLNALPFLVLLSRRTLTIMRQNVAFSLLTKAILLLAAIQITLPLWVAVIGDVGVALLVTLNALRLAEPTGEPVPPKTAHARKLQSLDEIKARPGANHPISTESAPMTTDEAEPLMELLFIHDPTADEQPIPGYVYPRWETRVIPFTGEPIRFGRKVATSALAVQVDDEGMSRLHGEFRLDGRRPVVVDLRSTNGIRRNAQAISALIAPERPIPVRFGDSLYVGRNTRIEVRPPGYARSLTQTPASVPSLVFASALPESAERSATQDLRGKSGTPAG